MGQAQGTGKWEKHKSMLTQGSQAEPFPPLPVELLPSWWLLFLFPSLIPVRPSQAKPQQLDESFTVQFPHFHTAVQVGAENTNPKAANTF